MQNKLMLPILFAIALSACGKKEEPQAVAAPEPAAPVAEAPAPAPVEAAAPAETPAEPSPPVAAAPTPAPKPTPAPATTPPTVTSAPATPPTPTVAASGSAEGAKKYASACMSCHGAKGQGIGTFPKLAGQTADVVKDRLVSYKAGKQVGPMSGVMMPIASQLSDADIDALSAHVATLK